MPFANKPIWFCVRGYKTATYVGWLWYKGCWNGMKTFVHTGIWGLDTWPSATWTKNVKRREGTSVWWSMVQFSDSFRSGFCKQRYIVVLALNPTGQTLVWGWIMPMRPWELVRMGRRMPMHVKSMEAMSLATWASFNVVSWMGCFMLVDTYLDEGETTEERSRRGRGRGGVG